jgi:L-ribulokinase
MPIKVIKYEQICALGAAMFAAIAADIYKTVEEAQQKMESGIEKEYIPNETNIKFIISCI